MSPQQCSYLGLCINSVGELLSGPAEGCIVFTFHFVSQRQIRACNNVLPAVLSLYLVCSIVFSAMLISGLAVMSPLQGLDLGLKFLTAATGLFGAAVACLRRSLWI